MTNYSFNLGIIRESRLDESRTPLIPKHIKKLIELFPGIKIIIQESTNRCFSNDEYYQAGAVIKEDLDSCDLILGVKEIDISYLIAKKKYLFFSHISKLQSDISIAAQDTQGIKKIFLKSLIDKKITLIDYENIRDKNGLRYLGFGRFAGIVGCYNSLILYEDFVNNFKLPRAFEIDNYHMLKKTINKKKFSNIKILITGDGRVAKGVLELLKFTNIKQVSKEDFIQIKFDEPIFCNLKTSDYVKNKLNKNFELQDLINNPRDYKSVAEKYLIMTDLLISSHYWDPLSPKIFNLQDLYKFKNLKVIGDITCDVNGSIPTTLKSTSIENPNFYFNRDNYNEVDKSSNAIAIMAVDNLPSELPRDSSEEFGDAILNHVLPYIIGDDDGRIHGATITANGNFLLKYLYLKNYISE